MCFCKIPILVVFVRFNAAEPVERWTNIRAKSIVNWHLKGLRALTLVVAWRLFGTVLLFSFIFTLIFYGRFPRQKNVRIINNFFPNFFYVQATNVRWIKTLVNFIVQLSETIIKLGTMNLKSAFFPPTWCFSVLLSRICQTWSILFFLLLLLFARCGQWICIHGLCEPHSE